MAGRSRPPRRYGFASVDGVGIIISRRPSRQGQAHVGLGAGCTRLHPTERANIEQERQEGEDSTEERAEKSVLPGRTPASAFLHGDPDDEDERTGRNPRAGMEVK